MSTKGPSNNYGFNKSVDLDTYKNKLISYRWAKDFNKYSVHKHYSEHSKQFGNITITEYIAKAVTFANNIDRRNNISFVDSKHLTHKYNKNH